MSDLLGRALDRHHLGQSLPGDAEPDRRRRSLRLRRDEPRDHGHHRLDFVTIKFWIKQPGQNPETSLPRNGAFSYAL